MKYINRKGIIVELNSTVVDKNWELVTETPAPDFAVVEKFTKVDEQKKQKKSNKK